MIYFSSEALLGIALVGLYGLNCLKPVVRGTRFAELRLSDRLTLLPAFKFGRGKKSLLNPATPFLPVFVAESSNKPVSAEHPVEMAPRVSCRLLQLASLLQLLLVAVVAPLSLFFERELFFLASVLMAYCNWAVLSLFCWRIYAPSAGNRKSIIGSIVEAGICLPYSINLFRNTTVATAARPSLWGILEGMREEERREIASNLLQFLDDEVDEASMYASYRDQLQELLE